MREGQPSWRKAVRARDSPLRAARLARSAAPASLGPRGPRIRASGPKTVKAQAHSVAPHVGSA